MIRRIYGGRNKKRILRRMCTCWLREHCYYSSSHFKNTHGSRCATYNGIVILSTAFCTARSTQAALAILREITLRFVKITQKSNFVYDFSELQWLIISAKRGPSNKRKRLSYKEQEFNMCHCGRKFKTFSLRINHGFLSVTCYVGM